MTYALSAATRTSMGRRAKDELAKSRVPAVMYGAGSAPRAISVPRSEFLKVLTGAGHSSLVDLTLEGESANKVLIKEVQVHPLTMNPIHVDFQLINMKEEMIVSVPIKLVGESEAIKVHGGTLVNGIDEVEIKCLPTDLPHDIEVDLSVIKTFDDALTVEHIKVPKGVEILTEKDIVIATVARPLTEDEIKAMEAAAPTDISAIKTEAEEKRAAAEAKKAEEAAE